jgi:hypothetical protein
VDKEDRQEDFNVEEYISPDLSATANIKDLSVLKWPTLRQEVQFAELCIKDESILNYEDQRKWAARYKLWILYIVRIIIY